jgi:hypothetical protein
LIKNNRSVKVYKSVIISRFISFFLAFVVAAGGFYAFENITALEASKPENTADTSVYAIGDEIVSERTENTKKYYLGENTYGLDIALAAVHYKDNYADKSEQWKDIDLAFDKNSQITRAPYILTVDTANYGITVKDKKTGQATTLKMIRVGDKDISQTKNITAEIAAEKINWKNVDTDLDLAISPENTRVNFDWIVKSENAPHEVEFEIEDGGIPITYKGVDAEEEPVQVTTEKSGNRVIERIEKCGKYPKVNNPSLDLQVNTSTNDGWIETSGDYYTQVQWVRVGITPTVNGVFRYHSWYRWTGFTIPAGSIIGSNS